MHFPCKAQVLIKVSSYPHWDFCLQTLFHGMHQLRCILDCCIMTSNKNSARRLFELSWTLHGSLYESETVHKLDPSGVIPLFCGKNIPKRTKISQPHDKSITFPSRWSGNLWLHKCNGEVLVKKVSSYMCAHCTQWPAISQATKCCWD